MDLSHSYAKIIYFCSPPKKKEPLPAFMAFNGCFYCRGVFPTWDIVFPTSYVGKIISDIIQTTSDLFSPICNALKNKTLQWKLLIWLFF